MNATNILAGLAVAAVTFQSACYAALGNANPLRPPGAHGEKDFLSRCIKCGKCIQSCPYLALSPASDASGVAVGTPFVNARSQACRLCEDFPCVAACPTKALRDINVRSDVQMGTAVINEELCIAFAGMRCEVCYRVCPLIDNAITIDYRLREGDATHAIFAPLINKETCVGCGLCVERCVVSEPEVAIRIVSTDEFANNIETKKPSEHVSGSKY